MDNSLFTPRNLAVLRNVERWRFVASGLPMETSPAKRCAHDTWTRRSAEAHFHREILIILSGGGYYGFCGRSYPARPGTVFFFDTMEPHDSGYPRTHGPAEHLWFHFSHDHCGISLAHIGKEHGRAGFRYVWQRSCRVAESGLSSPQALFPRNDPDVPMDLLRQQCACALGLFVTSVVRNGCHPQATPAGDSIQAGVIQAVQRHIRESQGHGCSLDHLARIAGYSKYHFLRLFREHAGMSPHKCVDEARFRAFDKMTAAGVPLKVMASKLGFAYPSALCRWRKRHGL